jgi:hypothetical protein
VRSNLSTAGFVVPGYIRDACENTTEAMVITPSPGRYVPDDPLDEGLTVVRVGKGYDKKG